MHICMKSGYVRIIISQPRLSYLTKKCEETFVLMVVQTVRSGSIFRHVAGLFNLLLHVCPNTFTESKVRTIS